MNEKYMKIAFNEAKKAYNEGEVPVGAVIVKDDIVIAKAHNLVERKNNALLHAEMIAISKASKKIKNWRLIDCDMYVTLEPCEMCKSAINNSRIRTTYFSTKRDLSKSSESDYIQNSSYLEKTTSLIQEFFKGKRKK